MTITQRQLDNLQVGDIVRMRHDDWGEGPYIEGPVHRFRDRSTGTRFLGGWSLDHAYSYENWTLEVVRKVPRFYVNADRVPVVGDVAHTEDSAKTTGRLFGPWFYTNEGWVSTNGRPLIGDMPSAGNILLVDGRTRKVVTQ